MYNLFQYKSQCIDYNKIDRSRMQLTVVTHKTTTSKY